MHYLRDVFPAVLAILDERLRYAWKETGFNPEILSTPPSRHHAQRRSRASVSAPGSAATATAIPA